MKEGGHLIVRNSVLETNSVFGWKGIFVDGDASEEQYLVAPKIPTIAPFTSTVIEWEGRINSSKMGWVEFYNSTIIGASFGIQSWDGGVIWVDGKNSTKDATFLNCDRGVSIYSYHSFKCKNINACRIMQADFLWDTYNGSMNTYNLIGIYLEYVSGINIGGCHFIDNRIGQFCIVQRPIGIISVGSDFSLAKSGNSFCKDEAGCLNNCYINLTPPPSSRGNSFEKLRIGIVVSPDIIFGTNYHSFNSIRYSNFSNNLIGISSTEGSSLIINKCTFNGERNVLNSLFGRYVYPYNPLFPQTCNYEYGSSTIVCDIRSNQTSGLRIIDNTFTFNDKNINNIDVRYTDALSPNYASVIKKNTFTNTYSSGSAKASDNVKAIFIDESCKNLQIACNTFTDFGNDIYISTYGIVSDFVMDGITPKAAMNIHSLALGGRVQVYNLGPTSGGFYPYYYSKIGGSVAPPTSVYRINPSSGYIDPFDCSLSCSELVEGLPEPAPCTIGTTTSIKSIHAKSLRIYPNPTFDKIFLNMQFRSADMNYYVEVISLDGKIVKKVLIKDLGENNSINMLGLNAGLYLVKVATANYTISGRVFIK